MILYIFCSLPFSHLSLRPGDACLKDLALHDSPMRPRPHARRYLKKYIYIKESFWNSFQGGDFSEISYRVCVRARQMKHLQYMLTPQLSLCFLCFSLDAFNKQPNLYHLSTHTSHIYFLACHSLFFDFSFKIHQLLSPCQWIAILLCMLKRFSSIWCMAYERLYLCFWTYLVKYSCLNRTWDVKIWKFQIITVTNIVTVLINVLKMIKKYWNTHLNHFRLNLLGFIAKWVRKISSSIFCLSGKTLKNKHSLC